MTKAVDETIAILMCGYKVRPCPGGACGECRERAAAFRRALAEQGYVVEQG